MIPRTRSWRDQAQLILLRITARLLGVVDRLFNVQWGQGLLVRMANHWQSQIVQLNQAISHLEQERGQIQEQAEALAIHAAAIYLGGRSLARNELCFDPDDPHDEEMLDASIDLLVKQRLAAIEMVELEGDHYLYQLEPDWAAIRVRLAEAIEQSEPETADWFREGLRFIDEAFLSEA